MDTNEERARHVKQSVDLPRSNSSPGWIHVTSIALLRLDHPVGCDRRLEVGGWRLEDWGWDDEEHFGWEFFKASKTVWNRA